MQRPVVAWPRPVELPTLSLIVLVHGGWLAVMMSFAALPLAVFVLAGIWFTTWQSSLQHEAVHGHPTRSCAVNSLLVGLPLGLWLPYPVYRRLHLLHHRDRYLTCPINDPESYFITPEAWRRMGPVARRARRVYDTLLGRMAFGPAVALARLGGEAVRALTAGPARDRLVWLCHLLAVLGLAIFLERVAGVPIWLYAVAIAYPAASLTHLRAFAEHRPAAAVDHRSAIVDAGLPWRLLFLNNNYHALHHARPGLPWYRLAGEYRRRRAELLERNGDYDVRGYGELFRRHALRPRGDPVHPGVGVPPGRRPRRP